MDRVTLSAGSVGPGENEPVQQIQMEPRRARRSLALRMALLAGVLATAAPALWGQSERAPANARRFEQIWREVNDQFYDPAMGGVDWQAVGERYRERAVRAASRPEFQSVVNQMLDELHASHLEYHVDDEFDYYFLLTVFQTDRPAVAVDHIGVMGARAPDGFTVHATFEGGPAARAGIRVQDRLLTAGGQPFSTAGAFRGRAGQPVEVVLERPGAGRQAVMVTPVRETPPQAFGNATRNSARVIEQAGKRWGYVHLWTMTHREVLDAFERALRGKLAATDGLLLDLRDGYGGSPERFDYLLFRPDVVMRVTPRGRPTETEPTGYGKPLVALINQGTRSAKEYLSYELKKSRRATLVGTNTAGFFLGAGGAAIADDGFLMIPISNLTLDGQRLERVGVAPDLLVEPADTYTPDDRQLARGLEALRERAR
jgi:carboxyl-terminal processing protease